MRPVGWIHTNKGALDVVSGIQAFPHDDCRIKTTIDPNARPIGSDPAIEDRLIKTCSTSIPTHPNRRQEGHVTAHVAHCQRPRHRKADLVRNDAYYDGGLHDGSWGHDHPFNRMVQALRDRRALRARPRLGPAGRESANQLLRYVLAIPDRLAQTREEIELLRMARQLATSYAQGFTRPRYAHPPATDFDQARAAVGRAAQALHGPAQMAVDHAQADYLPWKTEAARRRDERWGLPAGTSESSEDRDLKFALDYPT